MAFSSKKNISRESRASSNKRAPITQYYRSKDESTASPFQRKQTGRPYRKYFFGTLDLAVIVLLLSVLIYSLLLKANPNVIASNTYFHTQQEYTTAAAQQFRGVKNLNKLTVDESSVAIKLQKKFPEISKVQIELPFFSQRPTLRLSIAKPTIKLISNEVPYIIDSDGVVVAKASELPNMQAITTIEDQSGFSVATGKQALSSTEARFITELIAQLKEAKVPINSVTLPKVPQELDIRTKDQRYYVKFNTAGDVLLQAGQYLAARHQFIGSKQPSQYLDVRINGKIFYR